MTGFRSIVVTATDRLRLHVRDYGPASSDHLAVACLPGLARTAADFDILARALADDAGRPRRVLALDYRGRGRSDHDPDPSRYTLAVELDDVLTALDALEITRALFVGTSRGGLLTMLLGGVRPRMIAGAVLNDIGPVIETAGLMRIKGYVGRLPQPRDHDHGVKILRGLFESQFPNLSAEQWRAAADRTWEMRDGTLTLTYDPALARSLDSFDPETPMPALWEAFDSLAAVPLMVIRGGLSDLLTAATVEAMRARRSTMEVLVVADQGHAPLLAETETIAAIAGFIARCDDASR